MIARNSNHDTSAPNPGREKLSRFFREFRQVVIELERAYRENKLERHLANTGVEQRFGKSLFNSYELLLRLRIHDDPHFRRIETVQLLLDQVRDALVRINTWYFAESAVSAPTLDLSSSLKDVGQRAETYVVSKTHQSGFCLMRYDQLIARKAWGIGYYMKKQALTEQLVTALAQQSVEDFARDLVDLAFILPRVLDNPERYPQLVPPRFGRNFEQLITDILNEHSPHASLSRLKEDYTEKTDIRVQYKNLRRQRGARLQVTSTANRHHHLKKVETIWMPTQMVILSPWSLACAVRNDSSPPHRNVLFSCDLIESLCDSIENNLDNTADLAEKIREILCGATKMPSQNPQGPIAHVPAALREVIRVWVRAEAFRTTKAMRAWEMECRRRKPH